MFKQNFKHSFFQISSTPVLSAIYSYSNLLQPPPGLDTESLIILNFTVIIILEIFILQFWFLYKQVFD